MPSPDQFNESQRRNNPQRKERFGVKNIAQRAEQLIANNMLRLFRNGWDSLLQKNLENPKFKKALEKSLCRLMQIKILPSNPRTILLEMVEGRIKHHLPVEKQNNLDELWNVVDEVILLLQINLETPEEKELLNQLKRYRGKKPLP